MLLEGMFPSRNASPALPLRGVTPSPPGDSYHDHLTSPATAHIDGRLGIKSVIDKIMLTITIAANPATLWPPNDKIVPVTVSGTITDAASGVNASTAIYTVTDEYRQVEPKGSVAL